MAICLSKYGQGGATQSLKGPISIELAVTFTRFPTGRLTPQAPPPALFPFRHAAGIAGKARAGAAL